MKKDLKIQSQLTMSTHCSISVPVDLQEPEVIQRRDSNVAPVSPRFFMAMRNNVVMYTSPFVETFKSARFVYA